MLSIREMTIGETYEVAMLGRCKNSLCPCCNKPIAAHERVICVPAADKGAQGCKTIVGVSSRECKPNDDKCEGNTVTLKWRTSTVNPELTRGAILYATHKYPARTVKVHGGYVELKLWVADGNGCQQIGKLPASLRLASESIKMAINDGEFEPYDSAKIPEAIGCGKYQGLKKYGV